MGFNSGFKGLIDFVLRNVSKLSLQVKQTHMSRLTVRNIIIPNVTFIALFAVPRPY